MGIPWCGIRSRAPRFHRGSKLSQGAYLIFVIFLHGYNLLLIFSPPKSTLIATKHILRQNSVNHKKQILQQNSINCNKTPYIVHNISPHYRFSSHFSCGEFFHMSCGELLHLTICHVNKFLHMTDFSPRAPPMVPVTNMRYAGV